MPIDEEADINRARMQRRVRLFRFLQKEPGHERSVTMKTNVLQQISLPDLNGGLNTHDPEYDIADNQSPDMLNLWYKDMALCKRPGQMWLSRHASVHRVSGLYNGARVIHAGTKLYRWIADGMESNIGEFNPAVGYPFGAKVGDYSIACSAGALSGNAYVAGDTVIYSGVQAISVTIIGTVMKTGDVTVTIKRTGSEDSPLSVAVPVDVGNTASEVADKVRAALTAWTAVTALYTVGGTETSVVLTQVAAGPQDKKLALIIENSTCEGLVNVISSDVSVWHRASTEIQDGMADIPGTFCEFGDSLYYFGGSEIWEIAPDYTVKPVVPYVPVVLINASPSLDSGDDNEAYNLIGAGFKVWYNGVGGSAVDYYVVSRTSDTFTIAAAKGSTTALDITSTGLSGWKIRKHGSPWIQGTPAVDISTDTITLVSHGLKVGDIVQFNQGAGALPGGISAYDSNENVIYRLPQKELDNTEVRVSVNAVDLKKDVNFTVNLADGTVDFAGGTSPFGAPHKGTNNVWIIAYKTAYEEDGTTPKKNRITGCTSVVRFGGEAAGVIGGTRVFAMANAKFPYRYWRSDLGLHVGTGVEYFPDTSEELLDQNSEAITVAAKMGDELIIFKEKSIFAVGYSFDGKDVYYPVRECHSAIGCDMPGSVQLIDNRLVFAHSKDGVYMLMSSNNELENIVKPISANINPFLLKENNLKDACACDYDRYYWLCTGGSVYLWDYDTTPYYDYADYDKAQKRLAWYRFDNIGATNFFEDGGLCYGAAAGIVRFTKSRNDFGRAISAYFKSKAFDLGSPEEEKTFMCLYPSFSMDGNIMVRITAGNEKTNVFKEAEFDIRSFDWNGFGWNSFTWNRIKYAKTYAMRLNMRRTAFLQVMVSGSEIDRGVGLSGLRITYYVNKKIKG